MSTTSPMSSAVPTSPLVYTASVNPPRKAKRARAIVDDEESDYPGISPTESSAPPPSSSLSSGNRPILPRARVQSPAVSISPKATRTSSTSSTPPANLTRAQRESLRKQNHSRIEKARRTKINDALAALRLLVPKDAAASLPAQEGEEDEEDQDSGEDEDPEYAGRTRRRPNQSGRPRQEKEFKLEVLVRTVSYLNTLINRVAELEQSAGSSSSASVPETCSRCMERNQHYEEGAAPPRKRRRSSPTPTSPMGITQQRDPASWRSSMTPSSTPCTYSATLSQTPSQSPSLPPISSWLPLLQTQLDPSALPAPSAYPSRSSSRAPSMSNTPMMSAYGGQSAGVGAGSAATRMYPSPPPSDPLPPRMFCAPPSLMLPPSRNNGFGARTDEDAASLLLKLRSPGRGDGNGHTQAQTPGSLLGLGK